MRARGPGALGCVKISRWQIIWPSRRDNIVNRGIKLFRRAKSYLPPGVIIFRGCISSAAEKGNNETSENHSESIIRARVCFNACLIRD